MSREALKRKAESMIQIYRRNHNQYVKCTDGSLWNSKKLAIIWQMDLIESGEVEAA